MERSMTKQKKRLGALGLVALFSAVVAYAAPPQPETKCDNGRDDDKDGATDCADSDCSASAACTACSVTETPEASCADGADGDCDGNVDCADSDCAAHPSCQGCDPTEVPETSCADGADGDCDGNVDCADSDCAEAPACQGCSPSGTSEGDCSDVVDGDCDGKVDCADPDCAAAPTCAAGSGDYALIAWNDLGMHCVCPDPQLMLLLPPWNTVRAQVIDKRTSSPVVTNDDAQLRIEYKVRENSYGDGGAGDLSLDPQYLAWLDTAEDHFPGCGINRENPLGLAGNGLTGTFEPREMVGQRTTRYWVAEGIPAFPPRVSENPDFIDTEGGGRKAYLHADLTLRHQGTGQVLATTSTTIPVANGGCCSCHKEVAELRGYVKRGASESDVHDRFQAMMVAHAADTGVDPLNDLAQPTYDADGHLIATDVPIRCSKCHSDPALGGEAALDPTWVLYGKSAGSVTQISTLSKALHGFHGTDSRVEGIDPTIDTNCYQCHPGGEGPAGCFRGLHYAVSLDCADCHGDLDARLAEGQLDAPWHPSTLPDCQDCHNRSYGGDGTPELFGTYLGSAGHKNDQILCSTCHGQPHALNPSENLVDNEQTLALQGDPRAIGKCDVCHTGKSSTWKVPAH